MSIRKAIAADPVTEDYYSEDVMRTFILEDQTSNTAYGRECT
jgi:hypothetical protein